MAWFRTRRKFIVSICPHGEESLPWLARRAETDLIHKSDHTPCWKSGPPTWEAGRWPTREVEG